MGAPASSSEAEVAALRAENARLRRLLDLTPEQAVKITQANDEVYLIELDPGARPRLWKLIRGNNLGDL